MEKSFLIYLIPLVTTYINNRLSKCTFSIKLGLNPFLRDQNHDLMQWRHGLIAFQQCRFDIKIAALAHLRR